MSTMPRASILACLLAAFLCIGGIAHAQEPVGSDVTTPNFIDQKQRSSNAVSGPPGPARIRFLTSVDFPPFSFLDQRGLVTGFNVELARAVCDTMELSEICQVEARPFDALVPALMAGEGDAIIAGLAIDAEQRGKLAFTRTYLHFPARFVTLKDAGFAQALPSGLDGRRVGVVAGTAHEAMFKAFFPQGQAVAFPDRKAALAALRADGVEAVFGDGVGLSFWLASEAAQGCCAFAGGPYLSDRYLGEGLAFAVLPQNAALAARFDEALRRVVADGRFSEIMLRFFPVSAF